MRIYLDATVVRWMYQAFGRPFSFEDAADARQWTRIDARLRSDMHGPYLELAKAEPDLLDWFVRQLILKGWGRTYNRAFKRIAVQIAEYGGASAIDKLGELVREHAPTPPVTLGRKDPRTRAMDKIAKRQRGPG